MYQICISVTNSFFSQNEKIIFFKKILRNLYKILYTINKPSFVYRADDSWTILKKSKYLATFQHALPLTRLYKLVPWNVGLLLLPCSSRQQLSIMISHYFFSPPDRTNPIPIFYRPYNLFYMIPSNYKQSFRLFIFKTFSPNLDLSVKWVFF